MIYVLVINSLNLSSYLVIIGGSAADEARKLQEVNHGLQADVDHLTKQCAQKTQGTQHAVMLCERGRGEFNSFIMFNNQSTPSGDWRVRAKPLEICQRILLRLNKGCWQWEEEAV